MKNSENSEINIRLSGTLKNALSLVAKNHKQALSDYIEDELVRAVLTAESRAKAAEDFGQKLTPLERRIIEECQRLTAEDAPLCQISNEPPTLTDNNSPPSPYMEWCETPEREQKIYEGFYEELDEYEKLVSLLSTKIRRNKNQISGKANSLPF